MSRAKPHPPGHYPVLVIGSGPGGLQAAYSLDRRGVGCAVISSDDSPGGMFKRYPLFQRLISWTKPFPPTERASRAYWRYDWNSLIAEDPAEQIHVADLMGNTSYFPTRREMELGLAGFTKRTKVQVRYGCGWESTAFKSGKFNVTTSDGVYTSDVLIVAVGMTKPWKPLIPGLDKVPHYVDTRPAHDYSGKKVFIVGKRNSGFEIADALLPFASRIILASPRPARLSILTRSTAAARARYMQPYEDFVLGGGHVVMDVAIDSVRKTSRGYRVRASGTVQPGELIVDVDEVIAATGFTTPLGDLPKLGASVFMQGRLPSQTNLWESTSVPGLFFAGSITQGAIGLKKYGAPSSSGAVHGFRQNARVLARHIATTRFGYEEKQRRIAPGDLADMLLRESVEAPELWNQQSYLSRVVTVSDDGFLDQGVVPLAHFVGTSGPDAVAIAVETDASGDIHPAVYLRRKGDVTEHLLGSDPFNDFTTKEHKSAMASILSPLIG